MSTLLRNNGIKKSNLNTNKLDDDERMDLIVDSNDQLIEKLSIELDEIQGLRKKTETELKLSVTSLNQTSRNINTSWNKSTGMIVGVQRSNQENSNGASDKSANNKYILNNMNSSFDHTKRVANQKPQLLFKDKIDNSKLPFVPKLRAKPNALRELPGKLIDEYLFASICVVDWIY